MKRYVKEMAADVQREIQKEIDAHIVPRDDLEELKKWMGFIRTEYKNGLMTDRDAVSALLVTWDKLKEWQWRNAEVF